MPFSVMRVGLAVGLVVLAAACESTSTPVAPGEIDNDVDDLADPDINDGAGDDADVDDSPIEVDDGDADIEDDETDDGDDVDSDDGDDAEPGPCSLRCLALPETLDFGAVGLGSSRSETIDVRSVGLGPVTIFAVRLSQTTSREFRIESPAAGTLPAALQPSEGLSIVVRYEPTDDGVDTGELIVVTDTDDGRTQKTVRLLTAFKGNAVLVTDPTPEQGVDFGPITIAGGAGAVRQVIIAAEPASPDDNRPLRVLSVALETPGGGDMNLFATSECAPPFTLSPGQSRSCAVQFNPTAVGDFTNTLIVRATDDNRPEQTARLPMRGRGTIAGLKAEPGTIDFRTVLNNNAYDETVTLTNSGNEPLTISGASFTNNPGSLSFVDTNNVLSGITLQPQASTTLGVRFAPRAESVVTATAAIRHNGPGGVTNVVVVAVSFAVCPPAYRRDGNRCIPVCSPGQRFCFGGRGFRECLDTESLGDLQLCPDGQRCFDDYCDDGSRCTQGRCLDGAVCRAGVCAATTCAASVERRCTGLTLELCSPDGSGFAFVASCDDRNACTNDSCDPTAGCTSTPIGAPGDTTVVPCDDGFRCTTDDQCRNGVCRGVGVTCEARQCRTGSCSEEQGCTYELAPAASCDDGNACTIGDRCDEQGRCAGGPRTCDDGNACTTDFCDLSDPTADPVTGCVFKANTNSCDDANACTEADRCADGRCAGRPVVCDDNNPCSIDRCDRGGCVFQAAPNGTDCSAGNLCKVNAQCFNGFCQGVDRVCNDGNVCTTDTCDPSRGCVYTSRVVDGAPVVCNDNNACTTNDRCMTAGGTPVCSGDALVCNSGNVCIRDSCDPAAGCRQNFDITTPCDDGNACTIGDFCLSGSCRAGNLLPCDDSNDCTADSRVVVNGVCQCQNSAAAREGQACTSATNRCLVNPRCTSGVCQGEAGSPCPDDGNPCTIETCDTTSGCSRTNAPATQACDDGDPCTTGDFCQGGTCRSGTGRLDCNDSNPCTSEVCAARTGCVYSNNNTASCSDGNACTTGDFCSSGRCTSTGTLTCNDGNVCTSDSCDSATGCKYTPVAGSCSDNNVCTVGDTCSNGTCQPGTQALVCEDNNVCTENRCNSVTGCFYPPLSNTSCSDGDACTLNDTCDAGTCRSGTAKNCADTNACTNDSCNTQTGACVNTPLTGTGCTDGNACTSNDTCQAGVCTGGGATVCSGGGPCIDAACNTLTGCVYTNRADNASCDDGLFCTVSDRCASLVCNGTSRDCSAVLTDTQCQTAVCNESSDACVAQTNAAKLGQSCNDGNGRTYNDVCTVPQGQTVAVCRGTPCECQSSDGPCCGNGCNFSSSSTICATNLNRETSCRDSNGNAATGCRTSIWARSQTQTCTGGAAACSGSLTWSGWSLTTSCGSTGACDDSSGTPTCTTPASCAAWVNNGDGTSTDNSTGLMWVTNADGTYCNGSGLCTQSAAGTYCDGLVFAGFSDWRLPNISELRTTLFGCANTVTGGSCNVTNTCTNASCENGACGGCTLDAGPDGGCYRRAGILTGTCGGGYWSSNTVTGGGGSQGWVVYLRQGSVASVSRSTDVRARCVRP